MPSMSQTAVDFAQLVSAGGTLLLISLYALSRRGVRVGPVLVRLTVADVVGLGFVFLAPLTMLWGFGGYILDAEAGYWMPGDIRSSDAFVAVCWFFIVVVGPALSLAGLAILWRERRRRE